MELLSPRERDIARDRAKGLLTKEIACLRAISVNTVRTHLRRVHQKLGVHRQSELLLCFTPVRLR